MAIGGWRWGPVNRQELDVQDFLVPDITCDGCVRAITASVQRLDPAARVEADLATKQVRIASAAAPAALIGAMEDAGFSPERAA